MAICGLPPSLNHYYDRRLILSVLVLTKEGKGTPLSRSRGMPVRSRDLAGKAVMILMPTQEE
jgi:hypothetical protein